MTDPVPETVENLSSGIYNNLITSIVQDIVARETAKQRLLNSRYPNLVPYVRDDTGQLDISGNPKAQESSKYFTCKNCGREVSANRFAAHLERCLGRGGRR
ncbi:similar to Saccharomyces cerevisiae YPL047W SGF11 Integral subunit of SAGA histone acetyltransferase complex [Maudiozyma barnettii]|uniref:SAGA-associated factor 11 n=1 Tax=Maudiozyma barnettii TaxID=61262 RepID=A0A8H2VJ60_9SACH|nr:SAGA histone acetyltransferase complex subunit SGF11 [Kazachstania barnettii]CAB4256624.1 similar to Saccharomyces cerevisiae YPL047W SGF11 Integral subunit of SAGA histone acetyltransferase complex [Kazachstania barnettii]CAD1785227.1 similar to Saccharomyces cerevisiae YPL047W SGF11 Integral subunit of SAGA histone acetyltransferase complex [Kazachstania barnettii]